MALSVATNTGALMAQAAASGVNKEMEVSMERLSSGKRINSASDDAAGVAIASRLTAEIRGTNQAIRNAMDGQALIDTAEGAHIEITNLLQRMREISVQAANDTNNSTDRDNLETEYQSLANEIDRIAQVTTWAGKALLNGTYSSGSVTGSGTGSQTFEFHVGSKANAADTISSSITSVRTGVLGVDGDTTVNATNDGSAVTVANNDASNIQLTVASSASNASMVVKVDIDGTTVSVTIATLHADSRITAASGAAALATQISALSGYTATATGSTITMVKDGTFTDIFTTTTAAKAMITTLDTALQTIATQRASLGSISNRLDSTVSNLTNISANLSAGRGRIEDADFASETTNLARTQILQQASTAMLAQANASKQNVLSLLQG